MISLILAATTLAFNPRAAVPLAPTALSHAPGSCHVRLASNGMQLPDPSCTPGAVNPTLTPQVLFSKGFHTGLVRDKLTSEQEKKVVYSWYGIKEPANNKGASQICELDHLVDLLLGGADTFDNIWPQCQAPGAKPVPVGQREFKIKDRFAEYAAVKALKNHPEQQAALQRQVAKDWTIFIPISRK